MWYRHDPFNFTFGNNNTRFAWVEWRPPQTHLHYTALYVGICEYLRMPPTPARMQDAQEYLSSLIFNTVPSQSPIAQLQRDRVTWVREWLKTLAEGRNDDKIIFNESPLGSSIGSTTLHSARSALPVPVPLTTAAPPDISELPDPKPAFLAEGPERVVKYTCRATVVHALRTNYPLLVF